MLDWTIAIPKTAIIIACGSSVFLPSVFYFIRKVKENKPFHGCLESLIICVSILGISGSLVWTFMRIGEHRTQLEHQKLLPAKWYDLFTELRKSEDDYKLCKEFCEQVAPTQPRMSLNGAEILLKRGSPALTIAPLLYPFVELPDKTSSARTQSETIGGVDDPVTFLQIQKEKGR